MVDQTIVSDGLVEKKQYYCTEVEWREYTGFTNTSDFPSSEVKNHLENATEQVKKDGFHMIRWELVTKDSSSRYFVQGRYFANRYLNTQRPISHGVVTKYDIDVFEADITSNVASALFLEGTRTNRLQYQIPPDGVTEIDALNGFFKLSSAYPTTTSRQIYVTYWMVGKPLTELDYELKRACMEYTTILALNKLKTKRLKRGTVSFTLGKQTVTRDENVFDELINQHKKEYQKWIQWLRPFVGRRAKIGRMETNTRRGYYKY